jgi:hypothetical protein
MALIAHIDTNHERGAVISAAVDQIRDGLATLKKFDGMRAECIAVSAINFGAEFGVADATEAQAMSDRWGAISAGTYTGLTDFINATLGGAGA